MTSGQQAALSPPALAFLASGGRSGGIPTDMKRAAPEIYMLMRQSCANCREWYQWTFSGAPGSPHQTDLWHAACTVDTRIEELLRCYGQQGLAWGLYADDILEGLLRQLASAREYKLHGDTEAAKSILALRRPGDIVVPAWLADESRAHSTAMYKQQLRVRPQAQQQQQQAAQGPGGGGGGKGRGKGKKGAKGAAAQ